jgi:phage terminase large subunit
LASTIVQPQTSLSPKSLFNKNARQWEAWCRSCDHRFLLYGGAAGGGKSFFPRWWCVFYLLWLNSIGIKRAAVGLFCEDYPSLLDRQISKIKAEFPQELGELKESTTRDFCLAEKYGAGRILLRNLDDAAKYLSAEFAGIAVDELTRNKQGVFDFLRLRLRWPGLQSPRFVAGSNPSGIGHAWVKSYWIERRFPNELEPLADEFYFVPARAADNPFFDAQYHADLETLPSAMAKAHASGSWDIFAGQYFDNWNAAKMVQRPETFGLKPWHTRWVSIDWGYEHPAAVYWHAMDDARRTATYRELVHNKLAPRILAQRVIESTGADERIGQIYLSPDAFAERTNEQSIADQMGDIFGAAGWPKPQRADDDRVGGWMLMHQMLESGSWVIGSNCPALIRTLPTLVRDEKDFEDCTKRNDSHAGSGEPVDAHNCNGDDPADSARYGLKSQHSPRHKPLDVRIKERVQEFAESRHKSVEDLDPQCVAMMSRRLEWTERRRFHRGRRPKHMIPGRPNR